MKTNNPLILPNRIYPIGASNSPHDVFVLSIEKSDDSGRDFVRYHDLEYASPIRRMEIAAFLSLCGSAMKTQLKRFNAFSPMVSLRVGAEVPLPDWMAERKTHYEAWLAGRNTMPELNPAEYAPETFRPMKATVAPQMELFIEGQGRSSDPWYAAEEHGSVLGLGTDNKKSNHLTIYLKKRSLTELYADKRFRVLEVTPEFKDETDTVVNEAPKIHFLPQSPAKKTGQIKP